MRTIILGVAAAGMLAACGGDQTDGTVADDPFVTGGAAPAAGDGATTMAPAGGLSGATTSAQVVLRNAEGAEVGTANLTQVGEGVSVEYQLTAVPAGEHGFHFHMVGSCEAPTFESAGGHFNPTNASHGLDHPEGPHAGDMPNVTTDGAGTASGNYTNDRVTLEEGVPNSLFDADGTALVVHAQPDDHESQPSGAAGDRIACGVVERA